MSSKYTSVRNRVDPWMQYILGTLPPTFRLHWKSPLSRKSFFLYCPWKVESQKAMLFLLFLNILNYLQRLDTNKSFVLVPMWTWWGISGPVQIHFLLLSFCNERPCWYFPIFSSLVSIFEPTSFGASESCGGDAVMFARLIGPLKISNYHPISIFTLLNLSRGCFKKWANPED